jgi:hypothetical protein
MKRVKWQEWTGLTAGFFTLCAVFVVPLFFTGPVYWIITVIGGVLSAFATIYFIWNRSINHVNRFFERRAFEAVNRELTRLQMDYLQRHMVLEYKTCAVTVLMDNTQS